MRASTEKTLAQRRRKVAVWGARPFQLVNLFDMDIFDAPSFFTNLQSFKGLQTQIEEMRREHPNENQIIEEELKQIWLADLENTANLLKSMHLELSIFLIEDIKEELQSSIYTFGAFAGSLKELIRRIKHEMAQNLYLVIPRSKAEYYLNHNLFGNEVASKFSDVNNDIERAGKCLATGNYTATVFHLMRVMEKGVQYLGGKLGVALTNEKEWQTILNEINRAIKALSNPPTKMTTVMKEERDAYAAASERLQNVKDAWRNRTMHPKDSYDGEEAEEIFTATKRFMRHLTKII